MLAPVINGGNIKKEVSVGSSLKYGLDGNGKIGTSTGGKSDDGISERSRSKENRKSFFGSGRGRAAFSEKDEDEDREWVTQSDLAGLANSGSLSASKSGGSLSVSKSGGSMSVDGGRRSSSSQRPVTAKSGLTGEVSRSESLGGESGVGMGNGRDSGNGKDGGGSTRRGMGGSVRKRLSLLKLGKKSSKASVLVDSVAEEE